MTPGTFESSKVTTLTRSTWAELRPRNSSILGGKLLRALRPATSFGPESERERRAFFFASDVHLVSGLRSTPGSSYVPFYPPSVGEVERPNVHNPGSPPTLNGSL